MNPAETFHPLEPLARALGVNAESLRNAISRGELVAVNTSRPNTRPRWRVSESAWTSFLASRSSRASSPPAATRKTPARRTGKSYI
jgi:hypothetical protein